MPAPFVVQSIIPESGMRKVLLGLTYMGKTNYVHFDVTSDVLNGISAEEMREGDIGTLTWTPLKRAGTNGLNKA